MSSPEIYLDNASTTFVSSEVAQAIKSFHDQRAGNASSLHRAGVRAAVMVEEARSTVADSLRVHPDEIVFTSGGTESNNLAMLGLLGMKKGTRIIISAIEHSSVLNTAKWLEANGHELVMAPVDGKGFLDFDSMEKLISPNTELISVIHANNEVGTIQDLSRLSELCQKYKLKLHLDACQSFCKVSLDLQKTPMDLLSISGHKIHGPTGIGALYVRKNLELEPILFGGGQERGMRSGTYHAEGIVGLGAAIRSFRKEDVDSMTALRNHCLQEFADIPGVRVNGPLGNQRLCNNVSISLATASASQIMLELNKKNIFVSKGSACASGKTEPSRVLLAMGSSMTEAQESLRISISKYTSRDDIDELIKELRRMLG